LFGGLSPVFNPTPFEIADLWDFSYDSGRRLPYPVQLFGLHLLDCFVVLAYFLIILWIGKKAGEVGHDTNDFFLAGRSLGRFYQFFLNFGASTNADQAVAVTRETYRQGIGGMWIQFLVLFVTPFYWFSTLLFRRARVTTLGDYFHERFRSPFLGGCYAFFTLLIAFAACGVGYMVAAKTMMALTPKTYEQMSTEEQASVDAYADYQRLASVDPAELSVAELETYSVLQQRYLHGELKAFYSFVDPVPFYFAYGLIVAAYTMMGGFRAAAITDAIQGLLIIVFSIILIPMGLHKLGGFEGLHDTVPAFYFQLFGSVSMSDYSAAGIVAMFLSNLVAIIAVAQNIMTAGSATDENAARFGMIGGMFLKRFLMLLWALAGLIAIGLYAGQLQDPDLVWGIMTRDFLAPGAVGLMLVGILAANMSTLDASSVSISALFIRNIYQPLRPGRTEAHYLWVGRAVIGVTLLGGIGTALYVDNLLELFKYFISVPAVFGAPIWLGFIWRRLTRVAVIVEIFICFAIFAVIPNVFQSLDWARTRPEFLVQTEAHSVVSTAPATQEDIVAGRATALGDPVEKDFLIEPTGIFFERVARLDPEDPDSPLVGLGRFEAELWVMSLVGVDFTHCQKSQLVAARFFFTAITPFVLLILLSLVTKPVDPKHLDYFFGKIYTPVRRTEAADAEAVAYSAAHPESLAHRKLLPGTNWEIARPLKLDVLGLGASWLVVGLVLLALWGMLRLGA